MLYSSVNGCINEQINISDRGLAYGDGIFTTALIQNSQVQLLKQHLARLTQGCQLLSIDFESQSSLITEVNQIASQFPNAVLKIIITAGSGGRGYSKVGANEARTIISVHGIPEHYQSWQTKGISVGLAQNLLGLNPMLKGLKHLNRLEQVLIRKELDQTSFDDLIVSDINNHIIETSCANIFWMRGGQLYTPDLTLSGVNGLMRAEVLSAFPETKIVQQNIQYFNGIDAMFICNSVMGIVPINEFNEEKLDISPIKNIQRIIDNKIITP